MQLNFVALTLSALVALGSAAAPYNTTGVAAPTGGAAAPSGTAAPSASGASGTGSSPSATGSPILPNGGAINTISSGALGLVIAGGVILAL